MAKLFWSITASASILLLSVTGAYAADIPGSKDPTFLKRFKGSEIIAYLTRPFDALTVYDSSGYVDGAHGTRVEGSVTRIIYRVPVGHPALEVLRNYEAAAKQAGFTQTSEILCGQAATFFSPAFFNQISFGKMDDPFYVGGTNPDYETPFCYFSGKGTVAGQAQTLAVLIAEKHKYLALKDNAGKPMNFKDGEVVVGVDLVASKAAEDQMVTVKAADMADALSSKGFIDLYGVYFDTDKTEVKSDSKATLDEIASLMKIDRSLKLEVSGHTDNTGSKDHNMALSQGRANAVVKALVTNYGIDAKRLTAKGYGDSKPVAPNTSDANKAKNRRVELRKI